MKTKSPFHWLQAADELLVHSLCIIAKDSHWPDNSPGYLLAVFEEHDPRNRR